MMRMSVRDLCVRGVDMCIHIHTHTQTFTHTQSHHLIARKKYIHTFVYQVAYKHVACMHAHACMHMLVREYTYVSLYVCASVCMYVCLV